MRKRNAGRNLSGWALRAPRAGSRAFVCAFAFASTLPIPDDSGSDGNDGDGDSDNDDMIDRLESAFRFLQIASIQ